MSNKNTFQTLIKNATIINEYKNFQGSILITGDIISKIIISPKTLEEVEKEANKVIDAEGLYLIPGVIDDHVHFRDPGDTYKGDIKTESRAAVLGGVTSFMDMPNNTPPTNTIKALEKKYKHAAEESYANYSFYLAANNDNLEEIKKINPKKNCGVKVFMGSSTGNLLVNNNNSLHEIFANAPCLIATHCETEEIIQNNLKTAKKKYTDNVSKKANIPFSEHPNIRNRESCLKSSLKAINLAEETGARLHILHVSTKEELEAIEQARINNRNITAEACVSYLWFDDRDYAAMGAKIKCNPAIKNLADKIKLREAVRNSVIATVGTDHAPHLFSEKDKDYLHSPSGIPMIQHSLQLMLQLSEEGIFTMERVVRLMCHKPAECFNIQKRGFIKEGYYADLVLIQPSFSKPYKVSKKNIAYKCKWSPFEGKSFDYKIHSTFVNGTQVVSKGRLTGKTNSKRLLFNPDKSKK